MIQTGFGFMKRIRLTEIKNPLVIEYIDDLHQKIEKVVKLLNSQFPAKFKLQLDKRTFEIRHALHPKASFEDDGNTYCPGNEYKIHWIYPFIADKPIETVYFYNHMLEAAIGFRAEISDLDYDGRLNNPKSFEAFLAKFRDFEGNPDMWRFGLYNIQDSALPYVVMEVNKMYEYYKIKQKMKLFEKL